MTTVIVNGFFVGLIYALLGVGLVPARSTSTVMTSAP